MPFNKPRTPDELKRELKQTAAGLRRRSHVFTRSNTVRVANGNREDMRAARKRIAAALVAAAEVLENHVFTWEL